MPLSWDAKRGLNAAGLWTAVEVATRGLLIAAVGLGFFVSGTLTKESLATGPFLGTAFIATLILALVALAAIFRRRTTRERLGLDALGYKFDSHRVIAGLASGLLLLAVVYFGTSEVDVALFPELGKQSEALARSMVETGPLLVVAAIQANGILGPLVEEFAWRGYVQYRLVRAWGSWAGLAGTAVLFALKHIIVDVSLGRATTLLVGSFALGFIQQRWGTAASTAAHLIVNFIATSCLFVTILRD